MKQIVFLYNDYLLVCSWQGEQYVQNKAALDTVGELPLRRGYILIIPDELIYLVPIDASNISKGVSKNKVKDMVRYHLAYKFPEEEIQGRFGYLLSHEGSPIIACMYNEELKSLYLDNEKLFDSAGIITTPSIIALLFKQEEPSPFSIRTEKGALLKHDNQFLHIVGDLSDYPYPDGLKDIDIKTDYLINTIRDKKDLTQLSLRLSLGDNKKGHFGADDLSKRDLLFIALIYIFFIAAMFLKTIPIEKNINNYKNAINEQYKKAGIADKLDPYGQLLFKVNQIKGQSSQGPSVLQTLSAIGDTFGEELTVETVTITRSEGSQSPLTLKMKGHIGNYQALEKGLIKLSKLISMKLTIDTTDVEDNIVSFTVTGTLG